MTAFLHGALRNALPLRRLNLIRSLEGVDRRERRRQLYVIELG